MKAQSIFGDGNFLMLHRAAFGITDNIAEAVLLNELCSIQQMHDRDRERDPGMPSDFARTNDFLRSRCHLGPREFDNAKRRLEAKGFVELRITYDPVRVNYSVQWKRITEALELEDELKRAGKNSGEAPRRNGKVIGTPENGGVPRRNGKVQTERPDSKTSENISAPPAAEKVYPAQARELVAKFGDAFQKRFGCVYQPSRSDLVAARVLCASGVSTDEALRVAEAGWSSGKFWGSRVATVVMLRTRWNEIRAELPVVHAGGEDWAAEVRAASKGGAA